MADRPILFSGAMIRALLDDRKTQTRRILKPLPNRTIFFDAKKAGANQHQSPRFAAGDRLWVREGWWIATRYTYGTTPGGCDIPPPPLAHRRSDPVHYASDGDPKNHGNRHYGPNGLRPGSGAFAAPDPYAVWLRKPSIHMPRWASRITLKVTDVRVERLQDCSDDDALAEGVEGTISPVAGRDIDIDGQYWPGGPQRMYRELWEQINGPGSWNANPWVVAYTFTVERGNIDQIGRAAA